MNNQLINAIKENNIELTKKFISSGATLNIHDPECGLTLLMIAAGYGYKEMVTLLLTNGANLHVTDPGAGANALHKACQGGHFEIVRILVEEGALINAQTATTGHTPLLEAFWFKHFDIVQYLLELNASINIDSHYGFTLEQHFEYEYKVNIKGREEVQKAKEAFDRRKEKDKKLVESQVLMAAVSEGNLEEVKEIIAGGTSIDERSPVLGGFNDFHTPLLVACRDGHIEIAEELIKAGADVNAIEPTFGAVPLHKATYNGYAEITKLLVKQPGINLNYQGPSNGYTPLHDALWHGYSHCAEILIDAGASLNLHGHDGKLPLDIATEVFGIAHSVPKNILSKSK